MTMEKALFIETGRRWQADGRWDRIYFGTESCPRLIPSLPEASRALERAASAGKKFTLVTPYLHDEGLRQVERILNGMDGALEPEVVINDYGLAALLRDGGRMVRPVLGRLLVKGMVGYRDHGVSGSLSKYMSAGNLQHPVFFDFLGRLGIGRVEVDHLYNLEAGAAPDAGVSFSMHYPNGLVTLTSRCPWRFDGVRWETGPCSRNCLGGEFTMTGEGRGTPVLMRGCAQFSLGRNPARDIGRLGVDRLVYHPSPGEEI